MEVYEYKVKLLVKCDIDYEQLINKLNHFIDSALAKNKKFIEYHNKRQYKGYTHDFLYPVEKNGVYKKIIIIL